MAELEQDGYESPDSESEIASSPIRPVSYGDEESFVAYSESTSSLCDLNNTDQFDVSVIRRLCLCETCKKSFNTPQEILQLFAHHCPGCNVPRVQEVDQDESAENMHVGSSDPPDELSQPLEGTEEVCDDHFICSSGKNDGNRHYMKDAKFLPCLHHFCAECLRIEVQKQLDVLENDGNFRCPECPNAKPLAIKECGEVEYDELESTLLKIMVDTYVFERRLLEEKELCDQCFEENRQTAVAECVDESGDDLVPLCGDCLRRHKSGRATKNHKVMSTDDLRNAGRLSSRDRFSHYKAPLCKIHQDSRLCMYCPNHKTVVCMKCAREAGHESCTGLFDVNAHFDKEYALKHKEQFEQTKTRVHILSGNIEAAIKSIGFKIKTLSNNCNEIIAEVNRRSCSLKQEIETQRQCLVDQAKRISQLKQEDFHSHLHTLQAIKDGIDNSLRWIQTFMDASTPVGFFLCKHRMEQKMNSFLEYKLHYQEDDKLMNTKIFHKTRESPMAFKPLLAQYLGVVYSTPCLKSFTIAERHFPLTLECRDVCGTRLSKCLPDIEAHLFATDFDELPRASDDDQCSRSTRITCTTVKHSHDGVYNFKINSVVLPGRYSFLISYKNPPAFFLYEKYGQIYNLHYSHESGFRLQH